MCDIQFFVCEHCGNLVTMVHDAKVPMMCCGQKMTKLIPGTADASREKHVPIVTVDGSIVRADIGVDAHPMTEEHRILWVALQTDKGCQRKYLAVGDSPVVTFALSDEKPIAVYAYCNLHGLWSAEVNTDICPLQPVNTAATANYTVCMCNNVTYFDILDALQNHSKMEQLLDVFSSVKNTTHCTTGCGGCYERVIQIISETMMS